MPITRTAEPRAATIATTLAIASAPSTPSAGSEVSALTSHGDAISTVTKITLDAKPGSAPRIAPAEPGGCGAAVRTGAPPSAVAASSTLVPCATSAAAQVATAGRSAAAAAPSAPASAA